MTDVFQIHCLQSIGDREIRGLSEVLIDCVEGGASVGFLHPISRAKAEAYWSKISESALGGERRLLVAEEANAIVGTVQVVLNQPENQPHRGEIAKMLVHRRVRRRGIGAALLVAAERCARDAGRTLLVLDTASGEAERLYERQGWHAAGGFRTTRCGPTGRPVQRRSYSNR